MAKRGTWKSAHKSSGATIIERHVGRCKLGVIPSDSSKPKGAAVWSVSCGSGKNFDHKRGSASSVAVAKRRATAAARRMR